MQNTIKLAYKGEIIRQLNFGAPCRKEKILQQWKKIYGKKFNDANIIIIERKK